MGFRATDLSPNSIRVSLRNPFGRSRFRSEFTMLTAPGPPGGYTRMLNSLPSRHYCVEKQARHDNLTIHLNRGFLTAPVTNRDPCLLYVITSPSQPVNRHVTKCHTFVIRWRPNVFNVRQHNNTEESIASMCRWRCTSGRYRTTQGNN
jgi:hypothetical protein